MMQLDNLRIFLAVARHGNLAGAAKDLDINSTTVYRRLRRYEQDLGVRLFSRSEHGHSLTPAGEDMFATAREIESKMHELIRRLDGKANELSGRINVTTTQVTAKYLVIPHLTEFRQRFPEIVVELHTSRQRMDLAKREADIAIRPTLKPPDDMVGHLLLRERWRLCASLEYCRRFNQPKTIGEFDQHHFILGDDELGNFSIMQWLHDNVPTLSVALTTNSVDTAHHAIRSGLGIGFVPDYLESKDDQLTILDLDMPEMKGETWLLMHPDMRANVRIRAFVDYFRSKFSLI